MYFSIELSSNWWSFYGKKLEWIREKGKKRKKVFHQKKKNQCFEIELKISWWSVLLIVKDRGEREKDKFDSITESLGRLTIGIIHKLMDAGWINYEFILTSTRNTIRRKFCGERGEEGGGLADGKSCFIFLLGLITNTHIFPLSLSLTRFLPTKTTQLLMTSLCFTPELSVILNFR